MKTNSLILYICILLALPSFAQRTVHLNLERTIELAYEEHRWWDVRRWNVAVEALSRPIYGVNISANGNISRKKVEDRVFKEHMYLYPIPEAEVWKTNIENNPGW